ncbi:MAG: allantoate amidohydrolase [Rhizobiales bacterium]|nr:allantoate amidohydrolase [Hyphomicrobiales bacterium]
MTTAPEGTFGPRILALADHLAEYSDSAHGLTCLYLTLAHRTVAAELRRLMQAAGMEVTIDAAANVAGRWRSDAPGAKALIVGSHYDTVRDAGKYDGRLGILAALVAVEALRDEGRRLPFHLDVIAFSEEEGVRFSAPYIGSSAMAGRFDARLLARRDAAGFALADVIRESGLDPAAIPALARRRDDLLGYLEVHIEQGPVLLAEDLSVGIVTAIAGAVRRKVTIAGEAGHAGTVPLALRHDAGLAAAELILFVERRCQASPGMVGTVGQLGVPNGAMNVIPARCELSLDVRAGDSATLDAAMTDIDAEMARIAQARGVSFESEEVVCTPAVACAPWLQQRLAAAVEGAGVTPRYLMSGAGHDAVMFDGLTAVGMLFVRCGNGGVSHSPRETITAEDADIAARVLINTLLNIRPDHAHE